MIRLLRHDESIHRQGDGAVRFEDLASTLRSKIRTWLSFLQRGGGDTKIFQYCLTPAHLNIYHTFEQFKVIQEAPLLILHCKTTYCCQTTSSSTSITLGTLTTCTPSFSRGWFREAEVLRKIDKRCSSQPSTRCASIRTKKLISTWISPGLQCTRILGKITKIQYMGVIWRLLSRRDCNFIRHDPTQSSFFQHITCDMHRESGKTWSQEKNCTTKCINLPGYREKPYSRRICIMDARIFPISKREHPLSTKANKARSTGKPVA